MENNEMFTSPGTEAEKVQYDHVAEKISPLSEVKGTYLYTLVTMIKDDDGNCSFETKLISG